MRAETYLSAYIQCRNAMERSRLETRRRMHYKRLSKKLEARLWPICYEADALRRRNSERFDHLWDMYVKVDRERKNLWLIVGIFSVGFCTLLFLLAGIGIADML